MEDSDRQIGRESELDDRHLVFGHVEPCSEIQSTAARPTSELLGSRSHAPAPVASAVMYAEPIPRERSKQVGPAQSSNRPRTVKSGQKIYHARDLTALRILEFILFNVMKGWWPFVYPRPVSELNVGQSSTNGQRFLS